MKLTHNQQVRSALTVLDPAQDAHAQCRSDIEEALDDIEWGSVVPKPNNKDIRDVLKQLIPALKKSQNLFNALSKLDDAHAHECMIGPLDLRSDIAALEKWYSEPTEKPRRTSYKQKAAVKEAHALVLKYCKRKQDRSIRRGKNAWYRLSAILAGDPQLDLFNHMRAMKRT
jgi:hypothetical protein